MGVQLAWKHRVKSVPAPGTAGRPALSKRTLECWAPRRRLKVGGILPLAMGSPP